VGDPGQEGTHASSQNGPHGPAVASQASADPWAGELRSHNPALRDAGFGFKNSRAPQALLKAWRELLQPLFEEYGVKLANVTVRLADLGGNFGEYRGGNTIWLNETMIFDSRTDGAQVAEVIGHDTAHLYQARLVGGIKN